MPLGCPLATSNTPLLAGSSAIARDPQTHPLALRPLQVGTSPLPLPQYRRNLCFRSLWDGDEEAPGRSQVHAQHPRTTDDSVTLPWVSPHRAGQRAARGWKWQGVTHGHIRQVPRSQPRIPPLWAAAGPGHPFHGLWLPLAAKCPPCGRRRQPGMGTGTGAVTPSPGCPETPRVVLAQPQPGPGPGSACLRQLLESW